MKISAVPLVAFTGFLLIGSVLQGSPQAEVRISRGKPALFLKGQETPPFAYMSYFGETHLYREIAATGIHLFCFPAYLGDRGINSTTGIGPFRSPIWTGPETYDFSSIREDFTELLQADRQAMAIIRIHLDVPGWWEEKYPDECSRQPDGTCIRQSFSSQVWRSQAGEALQQIVLWLMKSQYRDNLAGIHVSGGFTEEWFYHFNDEFHDLSPARKMAFREWLKEEYGSCLSSLRSAWRMPDATFKNALPADISGAERKKEWRVTALERQVLDTFRFHSETMADNIAFFCSIVKEASSRELLTGAFYGYHYYVTDPRRGHGKLARLLECPDLDYLSSPNVYRREVGQDWPPMSAVQSIMMHGKLWMAENDTRTSLTTLLKERKPAICPPGKYEGPVWQGPSDIRTSASLLLANAARMLCYGYGGWWFDMWGGWFSHPSLLKILESCSALYGEPGPGKSSKLEPEVCVVTDEELAYLDKSYGILTEKILENRFALGTSGAPYHLYTRSDIERLPSNDYRVIWLLGVPDTDSSIADKIQEWLSEDVTVIWTDIKGSILYRSSETETRFPERYSWSAEELMEIWKDSGVHLYLRTGDVVYSGNGWLGIQTGPGGTKKVEFPVAVDVSDPLTGEMLGISVKSINLELSPVSTRLLRVVPDADR